MSSRVSLDDPAVLEAVLERIRTRPRQYWLDLVARYENEKPGDIVLPGVPPRQRATRYRVITLNQLRASKPKKRSRKHQAAA